MEIYLVRHAEDRARAAERYGDEGLSERGREQACKLGRALSDVPFHLCYCSTLRRARETAEVALQGRDVPIEFRADFAEGSVGRALVTETVRPGTVAIAHSFGHWEMSSKSNKVNGVDSDFDGTRAAGIAANPIMRADPVKSNVSLQDKIGGSASFSNTRVRVTKV